MLLVGGFGLFFDDAELRRRVVTTVFDNVPLAAGGDRARLERTVDDALDNTGRLGPISIVLLDGRRQRRHGARCATRSTRRGTSTRARRSCAASRSTSRWCSARPRRARLRRSQVSATRGARTASATPAGRSRDWSATCCRSRSPVGVVPVPLPGAARPRPKTREIWPGAVGAAALISLVRGALELYFEHLGDFGALYGSLGALMALLIFVYAVSLDPGVRAPSTRPSGRACPRTTSRHSLEPSAKRADTGIEPARSSRPTTPFDRDELIAGGLASPQ